MRIYSDYLLPVLINKVCGDTIFTQQRQKIVPEARGNVLEIGVGTGHNLSFYDSSRVISLTAIDPHIATWQQCSIDTALLPYEFEFLVASAESLPFADATFDTIVSTYTLCTIPDVRRALSEIHRVLKPSGRLLFSEHGKAPERHIQWVQNVVNPVWKCFSGGCNLNRDIEQLVSDSKFEILELEKSYISGFRTGSYNFLGIASKI